MKTAEQYDAQMCALAEQAYEDFVIEEHAPGVFNLRDSNGSWNMRAFLTVLGGYTIIVGDGPDLIHRRNFDVRSKVDPAARFTDLGSHGMGYFAEKIQVPGRGSRSALQTWDFDRAMHEFDEWVDEEERALGDEPDPRDAEWIEGLRTSLRDAIQDSQIYGTPEEFSAAMYEYLHDAEMCEGFGYVWCPDLYYARAAFKKAGELLNQKELGL